MEFLPAGYSLVEVVPLGGAPGTYSYAVPPSLTGVSVGRRVVVPFGARRRAGIVLGPGEPHGEGTIRLIESVQDEGPLLSGEVIALAKWAADYYCAPLSHAIKAALPPGSDADEDKTPVLTAKGRAALTDGSVAASTRKALRAVETNESQVLSKGTLARIVREGLVALEREVTTGGHVPLVDVVIRAEGPVPAIAANHKIQRAVWEILAKDPRLPMEAIQAKVPGARDSIIRMAKKGLLRVEQVPWIAPPNARNPYATPPPTLTDEQVSVLRELGTMLGESEPKPVLLEGVTGSGKTEVYLRLIASAREQGGSAIVLVPEIALTPQLAGRFRGRFGGDVAVLHSGLTDRDRAAEWHRVRRGEAQIVVGARSAVFAPILRPRVIIVDEEHDSSFKQAEGLRYQGRDLAVVRAKLAGALVVLGSATPSIETVHNAERGRYAHLRLRQRVDSRPMPTVSLVDLRGRERIKPEGGIQPSNLLSPELTTALRETVSRGEQSIVFLNRRGHSTSILCRDCGSVCKCEQCSVAMTWHERRRRLVCHYCGAREEAPDTCPSCQSVRLLYAGAGTEKLEDELIAAAPGARIGRLDRDTAGTTAKLEAVLGRFSAGEIDILVGTQMVAKGHDFPGVTLVAVLLADAGLHQPDFRSGERTAQLLTQVAGRAGRGLKPGRVLIQTYSPDAAAIRAVITHDYRTFAESEIRERQSAEYPPYNRLCLVRIESDEEKTGNAIATQLAKGLAPSAGAELTILGPAPASMPMLRGRFRFQILLKASKPTVVRAAVAKLRQVLPKPPAGVRVTVDVDPVDMM